MQSQVTRYRNQVKELEGREDDLMKEKRHQAKEVREGGGRELGREITPSEFLLEHLLWIICLNCSSNPIARGGEGREDSCGMTCMGGGRGRGGTSK